MNIWLQKSALTQPRTSPLKFTRSKYQNQYYILIFWLSFVLCYFACFCAFVLTPAKRCTQVGAEAQALLVPAAVLGVLAVAWLAALYLGEPDPRGCGLQAEVA